MSETVVFSQLSRKFIDENDATPDAAQQAWSKTLLGMLHDIHQESAIYLMVRRLRD